MPHLDNKAVARQSMEHLHRLCVEIGPRPSGSPGNQAAAEYIQSVFQGCGLEVEMQEFACPAWEELSTSLELNGNRLAAAANAYSPPCNVAAPLVPVGTVAELEAARLDGCIGLLYGDLTKAPLSPKSWFLKDEREDHILRLLEEKRPAALITIQSAPGDLPRLIEDWELPIPSATVPAQTGLALLQQPEAAVRLRIESRQSAGSTCNVVARKAGANPSKIVLCAHYDTKIDTPGAGDNASGVAVLLSLAQQLSQSSLACSLEWVAFTNEEYLPVGDDEYLRRGESQFGQILAAINFDRVGLTLGANTFTTLAGSQSLQGQVVELAKSYPGVVQVEPWPESNHSTFSWRGVPSLAFSSAGGAPLDHRRADSSEWISPAKLAEVVSLVAEIIDRLQDKPLAWARQAQPEAAR